MQKAIFLENFKLALQNFAHSKLRSSLSALGIIIGVMSVIAITTFGDSATGSIEKSVIGAGLNSITVSRSREASQNVERTFTIDFAERISSEVEGVSAAVPLVSAKFTVSHGKNQFNDIEVMAAAAEYAEIYTYAAAQGNFISVANNERREMVAVLGAEIAVSLFPESDAAAIIGQRIRIFRNQARSFRVIGVMEVMTESMGNDFDSSIYVPMRTYKSRLGKIDSIPRYGVTTDEGADVLSVAENLSEWFADLFGEEEQVRVISPASMVEMFSGITETLNFFLSGVAAISLLVGGIGIMNIMLVSVSERTREIGIRKALGASSRVIKQQFLFEAALLTTLGGAFGIILGLAVSFLVITALGWDFSVGLLSVVGAVAFSALVGIFFGYYPAARASQLDPIVALAYE